MSQATPLRYISRRKPVVGVDQTPTPVPAALVMPDGMQAYYKSRKARQPDGLFKPSPQQQDFFDWVANGQGNCVLEAAAGCGKTTTLIQALKLMQGFIFFGSYNKAIAEEIADKANEAKVFRSGIKISTAHAAGFMQFRRSFPNPKVDDRKTRSLINDFKQQHPQADDIEIAAFFISKMVSFGKQFLFDCRGYPDLKDFDAWFKLAEHFSLDQDLPETIPLQKALEWTVEIFQRSKHACARGLIDFDDMIYAPIAYGLSFFKNDWVLMDEAQDLNPARQELAKRMLRPGGRAIFVGDSRQAIYGFTGAGGDSLSRITKMFDCQTLPLTITYRCPKAIVTYAHQWVSHIQAHEHAPDGVVRPVIHAATKPCEFCNATGLVQLRVSSGDPDDWGKCQHCQGDKTLPADPWFIQDPPTKDDAILCRYTRPLLQTAYAMIKEGVACKVEGRDIGKNLTTLAQMWNITSINRLVDRLASWKARQIKKAQDKGSDRLEQEINDRCESLTIFINRCQAQGKTLITELVSEIESLFADNVTNMIRLSTGHKAKGREWNRVFWIQTNQRGKPRKAWEALEEDNLKYVVTTRAKKELILLQETK